MALISGNVKLDGSADFTTISAGVTALINSGLADSSITEFNLYVLDSGPYTDSFSINIPNSGSLNIYGSNTRWDFSSSVSVTGIYITSPNFRIDNFDIYSHTSGFLFNIASGTSSAFSNLTILDNVNGINSSFSDILLDNVSAHGKQTGIFLKSLDSVTSLTSCKISNYLIGISGYNLGIINSRLFANIIDIVSPTGYISVEDSLFNSTTSISGRFKLNADNITINSSNPIISNYSTININSSILYASSKCLQGTFESGSYVNSSILYPSGCSDPNVQEYLTSCIDPKFVDRTHNDFRLNFDISQGSPGIELAPMGLPSGMRITLDNSQLMIFDFRGKSLLYEFLPFIYKQGSSLILSDYQKEIQFALAKEGKGQLTYSQIANLEFSKYNILTKPSFSALGISYGSIDSKPWDWDIKRFENSPKIEDSIDFLIPRSYIDLEEEIQNDLVFLPEDSKVLFNKMNKRHIKVWNKIDYRGVSYDIINSRPGESILWIIEGRNQHLIKQNAFTGENLEVYPLDVPNISGNTTVRPSGLVFIGIEGEKYKFLKLSDQKEYYGISEKGDFLWISTDINPLLDYRGVYSYKEHLFVTASKYNQNIFDRTTISSGIAQGYVYLWNNNDLLEHYISTNKVFSLNSGNLYPTDLTMYEDGELIIADYYSSGLYKYDLKYDYALLQSNYDQDVKVLLREFYPDVTY